MMPLWITRDAAGLVGVGMRVGRGRRAVSGPAGVADAERARRHDSVELLLQHGELAGRLHDLEAVAVHHRDARRVVAAVLEPAQPLEQQSRRLAGADVADDAAHRVTSLACQEFAAGRHQLLRLLRRSALRRSTGRSARCPTAGRAPSGPARRAAARPARPPPASANRARQPVVHAGQVRAPRSLSLDDRYGAAAATSCGNRLPGSWQGDARSGPPPAARRGRCGARAGSRRRCLRRR